MGALRVFKIVYAREIRELIRDRKSLFWLLAPPIILPAIALVAVGFVGTQTARYITQGFPVAVVNGQAAPELVASLKRSKALIVNEPQPADPDPTALIMLTIPDDFQQKLDSGQQARLTLTQR